MSMPLNLPAVQDFPPIKTGFRTTEFWMVTFGNLAVIIMFVFHKDFSQYVIQSSTLAVFLANGIYAIARSLVKAFHWQAFGKVLAAAGTGLPDGGASQTVNVNEGPAQGPQLPAEPPVVPVASDPSTVPIQAPIEAIYRRSTPEEAPPVTTGVLPAAPARERT